MSTSGLRRLEDLRRDDVERARREVAALRHAHEQALAAQQAALGAEEAAARALTAARASFADARTVLALRAAEDTLCIAQAARERAGGRLVDCRARTEVALRALLLGEHRVRTGELARRSVARTLEQRAADVSRRTERRHEDEAEDAFRAQVHTRRSVSSERG